MGMLSDRPHKIRGRATRVYEAYDVSDSTKEPIVIKDSWVEDRRPKEGDTLRFVLEGTSAEERSFFLTMLHHGVVDISGQPDRTREAHPGRLRHNARASFCIIPVNAPPDRRVYRNRACRLSHTASGGHKFMSNPMHFSLTPMSLKFILTRIRNCIQALNTTL